MRLNKTYLIVAATLIAMLSGCNRTEEGNDMFDNKIFIDAKDKIATVFIKSANATLDRQITAAIAKPEIADVEITYKADPSRVDFFNDAYYQSAVILPENHYTFSTDKAIISAGAVKSTNINVHFTDIDKLDRNTVYVLPVVMANATNVAILESAKAYYFIFKGAALINVTGNIRETSLKINWANKAPLNGLTAITMEALVRAHAYDKISSIMGIEGGFLMRLGDSDRHQNQLQIATKKGNFPGTNAAWDLPKDQWVHIALTLDATTGAYVIYINGAEQTSGKISSLGSISLGSDNFYIGKSYDDNRWLDGEASEFRIWNKIRTAKEIADNPYEVETNSEGLVAYWKFDDGSGSIVKDHSVNGNDAHLNTANPIKWIPVELPAK